MKREKVVIRRVVSQDGNARAEGEARGFSTSGDVEVTVTTHVSDGTQSGSSSSSSSSSSASS
jgi:hypothetical protein